MDLGLKGKTVIVTGGGAGICKGITLGFAQEASNVVIAELGEDCGCATEEEVKALGAEVMLVKTDVTKLKNVQNMVKTTLDRFGQIDVLVHCAMAFGPTMGGFFMERPIEDWDIEIDSCIYGALNCCRTVLPHMIERKSGAIVNILTDAARVGEPRQAVYSGAKAAIGAFGRSLAKEVARYNIRVNCVSPGMTEGDSPRFRAAREKEKQLLGPEKFAKLVEDRKKAYPLRRFGRPEDIANAVLFLASDKASWITGQTLSVSGGYSMGPW